MIERPDRTGTHQTQFKNNKKRILASESICAICGKPVDKTLRFPDPFSPTVDHIIPVAKGGHPSSMENLQLAHFRCNRLKSDNLQVERKKEKVKEIGNSILPLSADWKTF